MNALKRILITGAGGFVGKRLSKRLSEAGHEVFAFLHASPTKEDEFYFQSERINIIKGNLESVDFEMFPENIDSLITLAQSNHFREFPKRSEEVFAVNVTANLKLFQWASLVGVKQLVHASSGGIYGGKVDKVFQEEDLLAVDSRLGFYLGSKLCSEIIFQNYMDFFKTAVILRPFFIYGPRQRADMLVARLIESVKANNPVQLQGKYGLRLNPVYVEDAVVAFENALLLNGSHVINVAGPNVVTLRNVVDSMGRILDRRPVYEYVDGEVIDYVGGVEQAIRKLNQPMTPFNYGIEETIRGIK